MVTIEDLTITVTKGPVLVRVGDEQTTWWATREIWDETMAGLAGQTYDDSEGEGRYLCYQDVCGARAVWGINTSSPGPCRQGKGSAICEDEPCLECGVLPVYRECACGVWGWVTDCDHQAQPRPIAPNGIHGGESSCEDCEAGAVA